MLYVVVLTGPLDSKKKTNNLRYVTVMKEIAIDATIILKQAGTIGGEVKLKEENEQLKLCVHVVKKIAVGTAILK